jgi:hypothetical protein
MFLTRRFVLQALAVDPAANKVIVTCKKSLVSSDLPVITSYEDAAPGVQSHGFISSVKVPHLSSSASLSMMQLTRATALRNTVCSSRSSITLRVWLD